MRFVPEIIKYKNLVGANALGHNKASDEIRLSGVALAKTEATSYAKTERFGTKRSV
ncbi:MAG: hypothetical protein JW804_08825 [Sedimentisphaerales bacterium]|nr:hypothetical protein [Sedimentisphaerales bacterium]